MKLPEERFAAKIKDIALSHSYSLIKETSKKILSFFQSCHVGGFFFSPPSPRFFFFLCLETNSKANFTANLLKIRGATSYGDKRFHKSFIMSSLKPVPIWSQMNE